MKCKMCGAPLSLEQSTVLIKCPYCHCEYLLQAGESSGADPGEHRNYGTSRFTYDGENYIEESKNTN